MVRELEVAGRDAAEVVLHRPGEVVGLPALDRDRQEADADRDGDRQGEEGPGRALPDGLGEGAGHAVRPAAKRPRIAAGATADDTVTPCRARRASSVAVAMAAPAAQTVTAQASPRAAVPAGRERRPRRSITKAAMRNAANRYDRWT